MNKSLRELKEELKTGNINGTYIFFGEEGYLREYYLSQVLKNTVGDVMPEFNIAVISEKADLTKISDSVESYPVMSEKKVVVVRDFDVFSLGDDAEKLISDLPEYCVLIFVYANIAYKPDKRKKLYKVIEKTASTVEFKKASHADLMSWVKRRFAANDKDIDGNMAEYMLFYCGEIMQNLIPEIEKISAYSRKKSITRADIEAVATRSVNAAVFDAANAVAEKDYAKALVVFSELEQQREDPIPTLALVASQFRRLYGTKLIRERGGGASEVMRAFGFKNDYPARKMISASEKMTKKSLQNAVKYAQEADKRLKYGAGWEELSTLVSMLAAEERE